MLDSVFPGLKKLSQLKNAHFWRKRCHQKTRNEIRDGKGNQVDGGKHNKWDMV